MTSHADERTKPWAVYLVVILISFVSAAGVTTLYSMLPTLYREFGGRHGAGWAVTAYFLIAAISSAFCGRLGDLLGRRFMTLVVLGLAAAGALLSSLSSSLPLLIAGCALQGTAGALTPLAIGLARESLDVRRVPVAIGIIAAAGNTGAGIAYLVAGVVIDHFAARGGFILKLGLALVTMIMVLALTRKPRRAVESLRGIDLLRGALFAPAIGALLLVVDRGGEWGWTDPRTLACLVLGVGTLIYWTHHQAGQAKPLIDVRMLRVRAVAMANLAMIFLAIGCIQIGQVMSLFLQQPAWTGVGFGFSATALGWFMLANNSVSMLFSPLTGSLANRFGARRTGMAGGIIAIAAWLSLASFHATLPAAATAAVLSLIGISMLLPTINIIVVESVPMERTSEISGVAQVCLMAFMGVGAQILYRILASDTIANRVHDAAPFPSNLAYTRAFIYVACASLACLAMVVLQRRELRTRVLAAPIPALPARRIPD
ncbi:MAG: MFS transporter [Steroidobacteraceae bacterium]